MSAIVTADGIVLDGLNYPFIKPEGFNEWLKARQDAFVQGVLYVYQGGAHPQQPANISTQEQLL